MFLRPIDYTAGNMPRYEIVYRKPPHGIGVEIVKGMDEYDAELAGRERYDDDFLHVREHKGVPLQSEAHDGRIRAVGKTPKWLHDLAHSIGASVRK